MLQKLRSNRSVLSVGPMGTWTWTGPIGPRDQDGPDQSVLEIPLDRVEPIKSVRLDSVQNRSVSVGLGPVQTEVVHTWLSPLVDHGFFKWHPAFLNIFGYVEF